MQIKIELKMRRPITATKQRRRQCNDNPAHSTDLLCINCAVCYTILLWRRRRIEIRTDLSGNRAQQREAETKREHTEKYFLRECAALSG